MSKENKMIFNLKRLTGHFAIAVIAGTIFGGSMYAVTDHESLQETYASLSEEDAISLHKRNTLALGFAIAGLTFVGGMTRSQNGKQKPNGPKP